MIVFTVAWNPTYLPVKLFFNCFKKYYVFSFLPANPLHIIKRSFFLTLPKSIQKNLRFIMCSEVKQVSNISILFQKQSMGHGGHFKFLRIFQCHILKKCFRTAVEAFKVWASKGNPTGRKFSKYVLRAKKVKKTF